MSQSIADPLPEDANAELEGTPCKVSTVYTGITCDGATHKLVLLSELVELWVPIEHSCADELIKHSEHNRR